MRNQKRSGILSINRRQAVWKASASMGNAGTLSTAMEIARRFLESNLNSNGVSIKRRPEKNSPAYSDSQTCTIRSGITRDPDSEARVTFRTVDTGRGVHVSIQALYHTEPSFQDEALLNAIGERLAFMINKFDLQSRSTIEPKSASKSRL